jgi:LysR family transcriptional regulator, cyn operon transcriptional activator
MVHFPMQILHEGEVGRAMNFRQLQTLITIADAGGFARAVGQLHLSQPAASRQIQALEAELGVPLFDRVGRRLRLTAEGEEIVRRGRRLLQEAASLRDRADAMKSGLTGTLRVGGSPQSIETVLAPFVSQFRRRHPGIEVHFLEEGGARMNARIEDGDAQLVLTTVSNETFAARLLFPVYVLAVLASSHPLRRRSSVEVADLADVPLLLLQRSFASRGWFDAACHNADVNPPIILESAAPATLVALAASGDGAAIVSSNVSIQRNGVKATPVTYRGAPIGRWMLAAWDRRRFFPPFARHFVDELVAHVRRDYPGRDIVKRVPPLRRPKLPE